MTTDTTTPSTNLGTGQGPAGGATAWPVELVEVFGDAIDDTTTTKTRQLADVLDHLTAARRLIGPRLAEGWHVHHDPTDDDPSTGVTGEVVAIAEPVTAPTTLATVEGAREGLAVLIDALRACLHAQVETQHDLSVGAHHAGACSVLTACPLCPPTTGGHDGRCESCRAHAAVTTWPPVTGDAPSDDASDAAGGPAPFRVCATCQPTGPATPGAVEDGAVPAFAG
jgi:hypothetical protein